jgi:hypothetical protein
MAALIFPDLKKIMLQITQTRDLTVAVVRSFWSQDIPLDCHNRDKEHY